jgi:TonB family protein
MDFSTWTTRGADSLRTRRLFAGGVIGFALVAAGLSFIILTSKSVEAATEEDEAQAVELAKEPEPEPEPEAPPPETKPQPKVHQPKIAVPTEISKEQLKEAEPVKTDDKDPFEDDKPPEQPKPQIVEAPKEVAPVKPPQRPVETKPVRITEDMPPPVKIAEPNAEYPQSAKDNGIEGTVAVRVLVGTDGSVKSTKVLKGPPELAPACEAVAKQMRFQPYRVDGVPTEFIKLKVCRFKLR